VLCLGTASLFFIQNQTLLLSTMGLKLDLFVVKFVVPEVPLYSVIVGSFFFGAVLCLFFLLMDKIHCASQLRSCRKRLRSLEEEVNSLRNLPLQGQDPLASSVEGESRPGSEEGMGA
jgi:putative membrane protein